MRHDLPNHVVGSLMEGAYPYFLRRLTLFPQEAVPVEGAYPSIPRRLTLAQQEVLPGGLSYYTISSTFTASCCVVLF